MTAYELVHRCPSFAFRIEYKNVQIDSMSTEQGVENKKVVTVFGDTQPNDNALIAAKYADLVVHEATFRQDLGELAIKYGHSTNLEAAKLAKEANAKHLILNHISARYASSELRYQLLQEARLVFASTDLADDFFEFDV